MRRGWILLAAVILTPTRAPAQAFVRLNVDNDAFVVSPIHDRDYTHGLELTMGRVRCDADECRARSIGLAHALFTPNIKSPAPPPQDRPYAGFIGMRGALEHWGRSGAWRADATAGLRGPAALGSTVQTLVHDVLGFADPVGWDNQLPTSPWLEARGVVAKWTNIGALRLGTWGGAEAGTMRGGARLALRGSLGSDGRWLKPLARKGFAFGVALEGGMGWTAWDATLHGLDSAMELPNQRAIRWWWGVDQTIEWRQWAVTWAMAWQTREFESQPTGPTNGTIRVRFTPGATTTPMPTVWPAPSGE